MIGIKRSNVQLGLRPSAEAQGGPPYRTELSVQAMVYEGVERMIASSC